MTGRIAILYDLSNKFQGSCYRVIWAKKSPCEGWLYFLVNQKRSSICLLILNNRPMSPIYFCHLSCMKMLISCLLKSMVFIKYFMVLWEMLTKATFNQMNFLFIFFSFLWHKILFLIYNMFIYMWRLAIQNSLKCMRMLQIFTYKNSQVCKTPIVKVDRNTYLTLN